MTMTELESQNEKQHGGKAGNLAGKGRRFQNLAGPARLAGNEKIAGRPKRRPLPARLAGKWRTARLAAASLSETWRRESETWRGGSN
jgi:hypothetical protein